MWRGPVGSTHLVPLEINPVSVVAGAAQDEKAAYAHGEERPLGSYVALMAVYTTAVSIGAVLLRWRKVPLPDRIAAGDLALIAVATHKVSRLVSKDPIISPLRAPFTSFAGTSASAELHRGRARRRAAPRLR